MNEVRLHSFVPPTTQRAPQVQLSLPLEEPGPVEAVRLEGLHLIDHKGKKLPLPGEGQVFELGRSSSCRVRLKGDTVSRRHALLKNEGGRLLVKDAGSTHGTLLNGRPVEGWTPVPPGGRLQLGETALRYDVPPPKTSSGWLRKAALWTTLAAVSLSSLGGLAPVLHHVSGQEAAREMLMRDADLAPQELRLARGEMAHFDGRVLNYLADQGVQIQITGSDLETARLLLDHVPGAELSEQALQDQAFRANLLGDALAEDGRLDALNQKLDELRRQMMQQGGGMLGGGTAGAPPGLMGGLGGLLGKAPPGFQEIIQVQQERTSLISAHLEEAGLDASMTTPLFSMDHAVLMSGARTDAEKAEYRALLERANGGRLEAALSQTLGDHEAMVAGIQDPEIRARAEERLEELRQNPGQVMLDAQRHVLFLPDVRYVHYEGSEEGLRVHRGETLERSVQGAAGFHLGDSRLAQVDSQALGQTMTLSHELGHALDHVLQQEDPEFHQEWHGRLREALAHAREKDDPVSAYSLTNEKEYLAEGIEFFFKDREHLEAKDPALLQLTSELLERGAQKGGEPLRTAILFMTLGLVGTAGLALGAATSAARKGLMAS